MSATFWIINLVFITMIVAICTSSYNDDKTKGL
jgi:hypothetical protein